MCKYSTFFWIVLKRACIAIAVIVPLLGILCALVAAYNKCPNLIDAIADAGVCTCSIGMLVAFLFAFFWDCLTDAKNKCGDE